MTTVEFITAFVCQVKMHLQPIPTPPYAPLWPSAGVPLGRLPALKGVRNRALCRWLTDDERAFARRSCTACGRISMPG
jgi:hypothetical protein